MGGCCEAHLITKVNNYIELSKDNEVTVRKVEIGDNVKCDYCDALAVYFVMYV